MHLRIKYLLFTFALQWENLFRCLFCYKRPRKLLKQFITKHSKITIVQPRYKYSLILSCLSSDSSPVQQTSQQLRQFQNARRRFIEPLYAISYFFLIYNQEESPLETIARFLFFSSYSYCYDFLFSLIRGNELLLAFLLPSFFT